MWYIYTVEYYSIPNMYENGTEANHVKWNKFQKDKDHVFPSM